MKKILLLAFGVLVALPALTQIKAKIILEPPRPSVEGLTGAVWNQKITVEVKDGTFYEWVIVAPNDTLRHFQPMDGRKYKARTVFTEITDAPVIDIVEVDNASFTFSPTASADINKFNTNGWSQFDSDVPDYPQWCRQMLFGSCSFSAIANNTVEYTFIGKRVEVWGEKGANKGIAGFKIDTGTEQLKDLYTAGPDNNYQLIFEADFPQGTHKLTVRVTGNKNAAATNAFVLVDKLKIYSQR